VATLGTVVQYGNGGSGTSYPQKSTSFISNKNYVTYVKIPVTYNYDKITSLTYKAQIEVSNGNSYYNKNTVYARLYTDEAKAQSYSDDYIAQADGGEQTYANYGIINVSDTKTTITFNDLSIGSGTLYLSIRTKVAKSSNSTQILQAKTPTISLTAINNSYNVSLKTGTGIDKVSGGGSKQWGSSVTVTATPKASHNFSKWSGTGVGDSTNASYTFTMPHAAVSLTASGTIKTFKVSVSKGTGINSVSGAGTYNYGSSATISATPSGGYHFTNWSGDSTSTSSSITVANITSTKSYTANAARNSGTVYYYANGGSSTSNYSQDSSGKSSATTAVDSSSTAINLYNVGTLFTRPGYHIESDATAWRYGSATASVYFNQASQDFSSYLSAATSHGSTFNLYANWTANSYTVIYNGNGHTSGTTASSSHSYGTAKALTENGFKREYTVTYNANGGSCSTSSTKVAYSFSRWATSSSGTKAYNDKQSVSNLTTEKDGTVTLYAKWTSVSTTLPTPTRAGYAFKGWATSSTASSGTTGSYTPTGNITLYAIWEAQATMFTKVNGTYKAGTPYVKINGSWTQAKAVYIKVSGEWKLSKR
jgi:uncharacterized repeat protein (TIGR02543 family)